MDRFQCGQYCNQPNKKEDDFHHINPNSYIVGVHKNWLCLAIEQENLNNLLLSYFGCTHIFRCPVLSRIFHSLCNHLLCSWVKNNLCLSILFQCFYWFFFLVIFCWFFLPLLHTHPFEVHCPLPR